MEKSKNVRNENHLEMMAHCLLVSKLWCLYFLASGESP